MCFFEINVDVLTRRHIATFEAPSRFPQVRRDIAVLVNRNLPVCKLLDAVRQTSDERLREADVFDIYQDEGIDAHDKSVAIRLTFQTSGRTLKDDEVATCIAQILAVLKQECDARLRGP